MGGSRQRQRRPLWDDESGGAKGGGSVFKITTSGAETVIHSFGSGSDGASPQAGLTELNGVLYGTTGSGGTNGFGTVFLGHLKQLTRKASKRTSR